MRFDEHMARLSVHDIRPRVVQHGEGENARYVAWTPTWEGPPRFDWAAARADLTELERKNKRKV